MLVSALENGTVIDHIDPNQVMRVVRMLDLGNCADAVYLGTNLSSKKYGKKGIIKVANKYFKEEIINKIALVSPNATIIEIKDFEVVRKHQVQLPTEVKGIAKCMNHNCVTNHQPIKTWFTVLKKEKDSEVQLRCHYCEKNNIPSKMEFN